LGFKKKLGRIVRYSGDQRERAGSIAIDDPSMIVCHKKFPRMRENFLSDDHRLMSICFDDRRQDPIGPSTIDDHRQQSSMIEGLTAVDGRSMDDRTVH
jgi:hypothetical protein